MNCNLYRKFTTKEFQEIDNKMFKDENENKQTLGSLIKDYTKNKLINYTNLTMNQTHTDASLSNIINKQVKKYKYKQSNSTEIRDIKKISIPKLNFTTIFEEQENKKKDFQKYYSTNIDVNYNNKYHNIHKENHYHNHHLSNFPININYDDKDFSNFDINKELYIHYYL